MRSIGFAPGVGSPWIDFFNSVLSLCFPPHPPTSSVRHVPCTIATPANHKKKRRGSKKRPRPDEQEKKESSSSKSKPEPSHSDGDGGEEEEDAAAGAGGGAGEAGERKRKRRRQRGKKKKGAGDEDGDEEDGGDTTTTGAAGDDECVNVSRLGRPETPVLTTPTPDPDDPYHHTPHHHHDNHHHHRASDYPPGAAPASGAPAPPGAAAAADRTVYVEGIAYQATEEDVTRFFQDKGCGKVVAVRMPRYQDSGRPRGYAHVDFKKAEGVGKALALSGVSMMGRYLSVQRANEPRQGGGGPVATAAKPPGMCLYVWCRSVIFLGVGRAVCVVWCSAGPRMSKKFEIMP